MASSKTHKSAMARASDKSLVKSDKSKSLAPKRLLGIRCLQDKSLEKERSNYSFQESSSYHSWKAHEEDVKHAKPNDPNRHFGEQWHEKRGRVLGTDKFVRHESIMHIEA